MPVAVGLIRIVPPSGFLNPSLQRTLYNQSRSSDRNILMIIFVCFSPGLSTCISQSGLGGCADRLSKASAELTMPPPPPPPSRNGIISMCVRFILFVRSRIAIEERPGELQRKRLRSRLRGRWRCCGRSGYSFNDYFFARTYSGRTKGAALTGVAA